MKSTNPSENELQVYRWNAIKSFQQVTGVTILSLWDGDKKDRVLLGADSRAKLDVRDAEVAGSNPVVPTQRTFQKQHLTEFSRDISLTEGR